MVGSTYSDKRIQDKIKANFVAILMDYDTEDAWVKTHKVQSVPTLIWADSDGKSLGGSIEGAPVEEILEDIDDALYFFRGEDEKEDVETDSETDDK